MTRRGRRFLTIPLLLVLGAIPLSGCIGPLADGTGRYTAPTGNLSVIANETPYSAALRCLKSYTFSRPLRFAVGQIADYTGKLGSDNGGHKLTQGAALMAMSALAKAGVPLAERFDTSVAEMELKYANAKLITDDKHPPGDYRRILAGSIPGSDYYLVGGITELNPDIRSIDVNPYVINVGLDLRLVNTNTLEVVDVVSYRNQIIGRRKQAGAFDFMRHRFFDATIGERGIKTVQPAVRSVIERAVFEMVSRLYHIPPNACTSQLNGPGDLLEGHDIPLAAATATVKRGYRSPTNAVASSTSATMEETSCDKADNVPCRWYTSGEPNPEPVLRGPLQ